MATERGVLQALWGEVRAAVEARHGLELRPFVALVNRHKTADALLRFHETLLAPPDLEEQALSGLLRRAGIASPPPELPESELRGYVWTSLLRANPQRWGNCRLFLDEPSPDRVWLLRKGEWVFYRWRGNRFAGTILSQVRRQVEAGLLTEAEAMLTVSVDRISLPNPKLPWTESPLPC